MYVYFPLDEENKTATTILTKIRKFNQLPEACRQQIQNIIVKPYSRREREKMSDVSSLNSIRDPKTEPLQLPRQKTSGLNKSLNTEYIDIPREDDSAFAACTRCCTKCLGACCSPRFLLVVLRILKALTFAFLVFNIAANAMFLIFAEILVSGEVYAKIGGVRDTAIRIYGLVLTVLALMIEVDFDRVVKHISGLKSFVPRAFLLFFIAAITAPTPLHRSFIGSAGTYAEEYGDDQYDDDQNQDQYDDALYDDRYYDAYVDKQVSDEIPSSTILFQMVTSITL